jgi:RsiW-degrading membrane proteinase PrsW (M82 family)
MAVNQRTQFIRKRWFQTLVIGVALFIFLAWVLRHTDSSSYVPALIVLGAFVVPISFVMYIYDREPGRDIPVESVIFCFLGGGALGVVIAGAIEYETLRGLGFPKMLGVGLIEESAKLLFPLAIYFRARYRSQADGLIFGVATGMGFAGLESIGYGFGALTRSHGSIGDVEATLLVRGLMSPAGHGAWTGLVCAVLWREREKAGRNVLNASAIVAFAAAVLLHALWDTFASLTGRTLIAALGIEVLSLGIAVLSLMLLFRMVREAARFKGHSPGGSLRIADS